ncbi:stage II sporulation protein M [Chlamydia caviae]|uniref:IncA family protein n=1 Tax=Chlamydia caviae (strain ATCC VR-813 / DSM 19441 / 03DC25 / GPIC) TaxID=227941 RepID=Q823Q5_CHLCV|nr:stage II sporulation protein M [Chlamydia caviae]AAP05099.1 conserved hypothetical protein [Chlamydia caviae GPIC]
MSEPKPIYQSPALHQVEIGKSFLDRNPKIARTMQVTGIVLAVLAIVASVFLITVMPLGLPISVALGGVLLGIGGSVLFTSVSHLAQNIKRAVVENKRRKLLLQEKREGIKPRDDNLEILWSKYHHMVDKFAHLNMSIGKHERSILSHMGRGEGAWFVENLNQITSDYLTCMSLLEGRRAVYDQEDYAQRDESYPSVARKNELLIRLGNNIVSKLSKGGGAFSLKMQRLSSTMSKVHTGITLGLVVGGIAAVGVIAAVIPGGIFALPMIIAAAIGIGLAVLGLSYAIEAILERSKTNKKQLLKDLKSTIDIQDLKDMTLDQTVLMNMLKVSLQADQQMTLDHKDFYEEYNRIRDNLQSLNEHLEELEFKYKHINNEHKRRAKRLEKRLVTLSDKQNAQEGSSAPQGPAAGQSDLWGDTAGFDELVTKGANAAQRRRENDRQGRSFLGDYGQHLDADQLEFASGWSPSGKRALEKMWSAKPGMTEEDYFILYEDVNKELTACRNDIQTLKAYIIYMQALFAEINAGRSRLEVYSEEIIGIWTDASNYCHRILNHLVGMQMRLIDCIESREIRPDVGNISPGQFPY